MYLLSSLDVSILHDISIVFILIIFFLEISDFSTFTCALRWSYDFAIMIIIIDVIT